MINPVTTRLSKHFLLSDFLGNHSVYTRGFANNFLDDIYGTKIDNGIALCEEALEPLLEDRGPLTISYGYIDPFLSQKIVGYMDPNKPSHHRWDLGAAADVCVHGHVNVLPDDDTMETSPIMLAHMIATRSRFSRMITYSESPYICIAVSAEELRTDQPRRAFYENRYTGQAKVKPQYNRMMTETSRLNHRSRVIEDDLPHGWRGAGHPTHHGGGLRQMHHVRVSQYTMLSDWLIDLQSFANGAMNMPNMRDEKLLDTFYMVGDAYDEILDKMEVPRMSIVGGFVSHTNPYFNPANDWRTGTATFSLVPPEGMTPDDVRMTLLFGYDMPLVTFGNRKHVLDITVKL